ncbi:MAG TPA: hypothetical protein VK437_01110 [Steroidobacteraceae bacterium]|nr:hypothetical protein [Steroidobacteraceae bacterium]
MNGVRAREELAGIARELSTRARLTLIACSELSLISAGLAAARVHAEALVDSLDVLGGAIHDFAGRS